MINITGINILDECSYNFLSRYRSSSAYKQLLIAHIMSKNNYHEILTTCQAQISPKIRNAQNLLKFGISDINVCRSLF